MYYILGHKVLNNKLDIKRKYETVRNTFLLALDGDIEFEPKAVQLLVDVMKKNDSVASACGRIHPVGSGKLH